MAKSLQEHLDNSNAPKRILSLDGGGIRGALTLGFLKKLETILRQIEGNPDLLLCDYFDLIGGTSTGSIIASALAIGKTVDEITELYMNLGGKIFGEKRSWWNPFETLAYLKAEYNYHALEQGLKETFKDIKLGDEDLKTGLCIVAKRADTNSVWPLINHPNAKYYPKNKNIPLWQLIRASSAAPSYFVPQMIDVGDGEIGAFVDGGVSMSNNPALELLMVATLQGFPFHWEFGEDKLMIVSVGTGYSVFKKQRTEIDQSWLYTWAKNVPDMLMQDASVQNQILLQWISNTAVPFHIDGEKGDMKDDLLAGKPLIKYLRYNFPITENDLNGLSLGRNFTSKDVDSLVEMSNAKNRQLLYDIGLAASRQMERSHFETGNLKTIEVKIKGPKS
jgi:patatin-like phospholipase/acyl hydrolase